jgi:HSF-type DNA-binding
MEERALRQHVTSTRASTNDVKDSFPVKLYSMLERVQRSCHADAVRWAPHGRAFKIYNKNRFEKEILPLYFESQTKYGSFQRQLNTYSFLQLARPSRDQKATTTRSS